MEEPTSSTCQCPNVTKISRSWFIPILWLMLLAAVIGGQRLAVGTFETGYWSESGNTPPTTAEWIWYRLPLAIIVLISAVFFVAVRWLVPDRIWRAMTRMLGLTAGVMALIISLLMSAYYSLIWYMD